MKLKDVTFKVWNELDGRVWVEVVPLLNTKVRWSCIDIFNQIDQIKDMAEVVHMELFHQLEEDELNIHLTNEAALAIMNTVTNQRKTL